MNRQNIINVSGVHGSGKSTLISRLTELYPERIEFLPRISIPHHTDCFEREKIREARYYLQSFYEDEKAAENPGRYILGDRCTMDNIAYLQGFVALGWIKEKDYRDFLHLHDTLFTEDRRPQRIIHLDPPLDFIKSNLRKRWEKGEVKWNEENFEYLETVYKGFKNVYRGYEGDVLKLEVTNLEERALAVKGWLGI